MGQPTRIGERGESEGPERVSATGGEGESRGLIDEELFFRWFGIWEDRFGQQKSDPTAEAFRRSVSKEMGDDLFQVAAQRVFEKNTFFPSPEEVIQEARRVRRAAEHREDKARLEERQERIKRKMEEQGRRLLEASGGGVEGLKEYLRVNAAVPLDAGPDQKQIEGDDE